MKVQHSNHDAALYRRSADGDIKARNEMADRHMGLVQNLATYYAKRNPHLDMDDLLQEGRIGVVIALGKFNVDKGYRFSTYATHWIKHYIQRYMIANHSGGASTSKKDTEAYVGRTMSNEDRKMYESRCIQHASLSSHANKDTNYDEIVEDKDTLPVDEESGVRLEWQSIERKLFHESIEKTQRTVLCMRFGVMGFRPHTVGEVASELGIPPLRVTSIEQTTVLHISRLMEDIDGDDDDQVLCSGETGGEAEGAARERTDVHSEEDRAGRGSDRSGMARRR